MAREGFDFNACIYDGNSFYALTGRGPYYVLEPLRALGKLPSTPRSQCNYRLPHVPEILFQLHILGLSHIKHICSNS